MHSGRTNQPLLVQYEFVEIKCLIQLRRQSTFTAVSTPRPTYLRTGLCCVGPCETSLYGAVGPNRAAQALGVRVFNWAGLASGSRLKMSRR
jgi:hypothetical protein